MCQTQAERPMPAEKPLLPVLANIKQAYLLTWENRVEFFKIIRWWVLLSLPVYYVFSWFTWQATLPIYCSGVLPRQQVLDGMLPALFYTSLAAVLFVLVNASIAVAWHRLILLGERPSEERYLRYDGAVKAYAALGLGVFFISQLPNFLTLSGALSGSGVLLGSLASIVIGFYTIRIMVLLPAVALQNKQATVAETLRRTRWNFWRLFFGILVCALPMTVFSMLMSVGCQNQLVDTTLRAISMYASLILVTPAVLAFTSLSYRHFYEGGKGRNK